MDIKELLAKCEELELKEDGIDNVVTGLTSLIADDDEWDELGEYIINTSRMYDKFCQPAMKKIRAGKGDEIDWRKIAIEGARMYAREIEPLHLDGDGYKKTAEYLKDYYTNLAKSGISESVNNELIIEWDFINPNGNSENDTIDAKLIIKKEEDGTFSWKETYDDAHAEGFETAGEAYENAVENENNVEGAYGLSDYDGFQIDKDYDEVVAFFGENIAEDFKPAKMKKAEYKEIDIKEPEVEKLKEEKDLAETPAEMKQAKYKDMKIEKPEVEPLKEEVAEKITFKLGDADVEVSNDTKEEFTAEEIKAVIEKENPPIFFSDADSYHYIMDFSFEKNGKKYWIESKHIEGDFSKFELNIYEGINESIAGSLIKELNLLESKEVGNIIPAEMKKAEFDEIKPTKILADENGLKAEKELKEDFLVKEFNKDGEEVFWKKFNSKQELDNQINAIKIANKEQGKENTIKGFQLEGNEWKELKEGVEDKTVNFMNKPLHYEFFNKRSAGDFLTLEVGKGELKYNGEDYHIFVGHNIDTKQFKFTVIFDENPEKNCDIMDSFLKDDISKADLENLKNAIYDEYIVNEDLDDEKEPTKVTVKVSDVEWDTDDEEVDLPKEFTLTVDHYDDTDLDDEVSDAISDEYGFCHFGFNYIVDGQGVNEEYINPTIFYSVERLVEGGNPDNIQDFDRIDQFDTFEQADDYIKRHIVDEETGLAIISSIYTYDNVTETPDEDLNSLKIEKFVPANKPMGETRADKIRKGIRKRVVREDNKANPTQDGCGEFRYQIGDYIRMTRKAQAEGRRLFGANFKSIKGEILDRFQGNLEMNLPNTYVVKMEDGTEESVAETLVEYWGTKRKKESVGESVKNPIESIHTGRNIYIKLNPEFENISLSELFKIIELGGTEETNSFWRTVIREKRGHITIKRNENESNELMFYPNTWKDKNFKIKTVAGVPFEDTFHAYGFAKNESFEDKTINEEEKTYYLYAGYYELYLTDHKLTPPYMYQAENTDLNQLINDNISEIDDEGKWTNPDAAFSTDSATICFDKNIIDELNKTDLFGGEIDMYHDALSDAEFNGEDEDKVKEDYHIYDLSKYYADKNESMNEVSLENAVDSNDKRQYNSLKAELKAKASGEEADEKEAEKLADKATKSNELLKRWKKAKGFKESAEIVVAKFDEGLHEIVKCDKGYFNRYNIKDGKARFTTQCVESLPTALGALKKRFPNACEDQMKVTESLKEEWVNFEGYKFKGIVNPKSGEIIYSKLTPKTKRITQADIKININDKESLENKEVIQAAKKAIN